MPNQSDRLAAAVKAAGKLVPKTQELETINRKIQSLEEAERRSGLLKTSGETTPVAET